MIWYQSFHKYLFQFGKSFFSFEGKDYLIISNWFRFLILETFTFLAWIHFLNLAVFGL